MPEKHLTSYMNAPLMERSPFFNDTEILLVSLHDIIRKLSEFTESSEDYIVEMPLKLGLTWILILNF